MMRTHMVTHQMTCPEGLGPRPVHGFQEGDAFRRPLAGLTLARDPARPGIKGGPAVEGASACRLVLIAVGPVLRRRGPGRGQPRTRLQRGLLIQREHHRVIAEWTRGTRDQVGDSGRQGGIPGVLGRPPAMRAPGLQLMGGRRPGARRGWRLLGGTPPLAPRPGASARPSKRWASNRRAHFRPTVRWTPTARATCQCACPAATRSMIFPRRTKPAPRVVDRCQRSKV
jgi:hypothetical protein